MRIDATEMDGLEATRAIHERHPETQILILTALGDEQYVFHEFEQEGFR